MKNTYQIMEAVGDPTGPKQMEYARFLDITFTNERHAYEFAWSRYWQTIDGLNNWQSYWSHVTTCTTVENALTEVIQQMKETTK